MSDPLPLYTTDVAAPAAATLSAVKDAAEDWGASWKPSDARKIGGGSLHLPVIAGLRRGFQEGLLTVEDAGEAGGAGCSVRFQVERESFRLWTPAVALLLVAAWGSLMSVVWPFWPHLLPYVPIGLVLAFSAWFLIVPRLRNESADDFLGMVSAYAEGEGEEPVPHRDSLEDEPDRAGNLTGELPGRWNGDVR